MLAKLFVVVALLIALLATTSEGFFLGGRGLFSPFFFSPYSYLSLLYGGYGYGGFGYGGIGGFGLGGFGR